MFFYKSTTNYSFQRILKTAVDRKSIDTFHLFLSPQRLASTAGLSRRDQSIEKTKINQSEQGEDSISNIRDEMPPKKLKLATKVKNLIPPKISAHKNQNFVTARIDSMKSDGKESSSQPELDMLEVVSTASTIMDNAIAKSKLNLSNLRPKSSGIEKESEEPKPGKSSNKRPLRAVVDIEMMKSELKQLEDPPITPEEKLLSANRLGFEFFDVPSETLARNLLGKILVRKLENGTLLKGKIVETESYLGGEDKASQTYQNKVTPRNAPMYMPPGTIYVYLTYGMYHCFNVSSRVPGASVFIRALEPLIGQSYMELLRNMQLKRGSKEKEIRKKLRFLKPHQLCNGPSKLCTAFNIDKETFNRKDITESYGLWIESDKPEAETPLIVVAAPRVGIESAGPEWAAKPLRFYIFENDSVSQRNFACKGAAVLIRAIAPIEGVDQMAEFRNLKPTANSKSRRMRNFKEHELSNGPSKFCMAFFLTRDHNKYSMCDWRGMWIEDNDLNEDIKIVQCPRIGIDSAGPEWAMKPLRFYILGEQSVSKRDKKAEAALSSKQL